MAGETRRKVTITDSNSGSETDIRAVSPVIGVVLLVGLTVVLSTVVAVQAIKMAQDQQPDDPQPWDKDAPSVTFDIQRVGGEALVMHNGSEAIPANEVEIRGDIDPAPTGFSGPRVTEGDSVMTTLEGETATVRVVWATGYGTETLTEAVV